ncbi:MAG: hypothetical protein OEL76_04250 [Siculibacillus sp.]|nr:hypothetical protein [Siculibacillus sp.]
MISLDSRNRLHSRSGLGRFGRLVPSIAVLVTTLAGVTAGPAAFAQSETVLRRLGVGHGADSIGVRPPGADEEGVGPSAIFAAPDGRVFLLDQLNGRILTMKGTGSDAPIETMKLPEGLVPQDVVAVKNRLYVWDGGVHALEGRASAGGEGTLEARAVGDVDDDTRSAFAQMGSQMPSSEVEAVEAAGRAATSDELGAPIRQHVASQALGAVDIEIVTQKDGRSAIIELRPESNPLDLRRMRLQVVGKLGAIEILDVIGRGDTYVFTESIAAKPKEASGAFVVAFDRAGRLVRIYDLPIAPDQFPSRRFVTVTPKGQVLYLKSDASGVSIIEVTRRTPGKKGIVDVAPTRAPEPSPGLVEADQKFITAIRPGTRLGAIQTGLAFEGLKWMVTAKNYGPDPDRACVGFEGRTRRPGYLDRKVGQEVRGIPYCWGCFGSFINFKRQVDRGVLAGNWCTRENPRRDVVGVDCSAFVSQCWGLSRHHTTADIPSITQRLSNPWDLKPGDALNKPGSHVMLFVKFTPDRKVEVLEASTGGCNGRVCRNVYPLSVLLARGYAPVRYTALKDQ